MIAIFFAALSFIPQTLADHVVVTKSTHTMVLYSHSSVLRIYRVALGRSSSPGAKQQQGDVRTPLGHYTIDSHNAHSRFHRSLHISYPNAADRSQAMRAHRRTGGDVMIHGLAPAFHYVGSLHRMLDWTAGCIAVTDPEIEEIYRLVPNGTPIDILP